MIDLMEKMITRISRFMDRVSGVALTAMMILVFGNVVLRSVWSPILGTYEYTALLASITIAFALAYCGLKKGHITITIFEERLPPRLRSFLNLIVGLIGAALYLVLAWQSVLFALIVYRSGEVSMTTETPFYPFILCVAFGLLMLALVSLLDVLKTLKRIFSE